MCGIAGKLLFDRDERVSETTLRQLCGRLVHRGPDDEGYWTDGVIGLGHRRLSVIDPEGGRQPIANEDGTVRVVVNGEIYDYVEIRRDLEGRGHRFRTASDSEVVVHLYEEHGIGAVARLRGMFALALWDGTRRRLVLARDRVGKKPIYYCPLAGRGLVFASELQALLADPDVPRRLDPEALDAYLSLLYVPSPMSAVRDVRKLEPAQMLIAENGRLETREYWDLRYGPEYPLDEETACGELRVRLDEAVRLRLRSDVALGAFLSGGLDSSAVVAAMAEQMEHPVVACTVGFRQTAHDERPFAREVARCFGCDHREEIFDLDVAEVVPEAVACFDEPFADPSALPAWILSRMTRRHVKVALSGDGGDEAFAGTWRHAIERVEQRLRAALGASGIRVLLAAAVLPPLRARRDGLSRLGMPPDQAYAWKHCGLFFDGERKRRLYTEELREECRGYDPAERLRGYWNRCDSTDPLDRALYVDFKTYLPDDLLVKTDRTSMAHGLEVRSPFLDHQLLEWSARLPASLRLRSGRGKVLLRRALAGRLPVSVLDRRKHGFTTPIGAWLRGPLRPLAEESLLGSRARQRGLFRAEFVRELWSDHLERGVDHGERIWALVALELWHRRVLDAAPLASDPRSDR